MDKEMEEKIKRFRARMEASRKRHEEDAKKSVIRCWTPMVQDEIERRLR